MRSERSVRRERRDPDRERAEAAPALIFDPAVSAFVWANSAGLALFGVKSIARLAQDRLDRALPAAALLMAFAEAEEVGPKALSLAFWSSRGPVHIDAIVERLALSRDRDGVLIRSHGDAQHRTLDAQRDPAPEASGGRHDLRMVVSAQEASPESASPSLAVAAQCRPSAGLSREDEETLREIARLIREGELTELPDRSPPSAISADPTEGTDEVAERLATMQDAGEKTPADAAADRPLAFDSEPMRLLAEVSHELRTPLTAIRGYGELIAAKPQDARVDERARHIVEAADHVLALIGDILDVHQIATGQTDLVFTDVDLAAEIAQAAAMVGPQAAKAGVTLLCMPAADLPRVVADARRVRQVLVNLASNAVKFTSKGGTVRLGAVYTSDGGIEVSVSDTGRGMAPAELEAALSVGAAPRGHSGRGIGLPLSRTLAEANGARLSIESRLGAGTLACLRFAASSVVPL